MGQDLKIAIVGCGIGGLATACLMRMQGHRVTIFDQFSAPQPVGSGLIIQPVGQEVLRRIGVLPDAEALGARIERLEGHAHPNNRIVLEGHYSGGRAHKLRDLYGLAIHRGALFSLLHGAAQARGVEIVQDHFVLGTVDRETPYLRIEGSRQAGPFDLVVDAGGAGSPLSPLIGMPLKYGALWGTVALPEDAGDLGGVLRQRYRDTRQMAGVLPIGRLPGSSTELAAVFWSLKLDDYPDWAERDIGDWHREISEFWPDFGQLMAGVSGHDDMTFAAYAHGSLNKPYRRRIVHIGDAAHQTSPQLGQGANMALLDAAVLSEVMDGRPISAALRSYWLRRLTHVKLYQAISALMTPLYQSDMAGLAVLRDRVLAPLTRTPPGKRLVGRLLTGALIPPLRRERTPREPADTPLMSREPGE